MLDEPLAGPGRGRRGGGAGGAARRDSPRTTRPTVLITHDLLDVLALADRVLVLEAGPSPRTDR